MCLPCIKTNFYSEWRARHYPLELREETSTPPERLLQVIWFHQRVLRNQLKTVDGRAVQVLHPGFWNHGAGPDFSRAVLQFDGGSPCSGDVEVDLQSSGWQSHRHHQNPNYSNVLLHVIWEDDHKTPLPTLALKPFLDAPLSELAFWLGGSDAAKTFPEVLAGQCRRPLEDLPEERVLELLHQAALVRFQGKAAQLACRARQVGWEQALWEGLFRALGYKQNVWPMQRLAELRDRIAPDNVIFPPLGLQARLLGVGGLLPWQLSSKQAGSDSYLRHLWDYWWRERESFSECILPPAAWRFYGLRPANHPQRRLGLAAHWLAARDLIERLEKWGAELLGSSDAAAGLLNVFQVAEDAFWSWHWTLRSKKLPKPQPLIGATRITDLAVNVILPWLWMRAVEEKNSVSQATLERAYFAWPASDENSTLKLAELRLLGWRYSRIVRSAAAQQGLLQIVRDFCDQSNAVCANCPFPELIKQWRG